MSEEISEAAWERALNKRVMQGRDVLEMPAGGRLYRLGDNEYDVTREEALAAQAEIDRGNEISANEIYAGKYALFKVYQQLSGNVFPGQALFEQVNERIVVSILQAARKANPR